MNKTYMWGVCVCVFFFLAGVFDMCISDQTNL